MRSPVGEGDGEKHSYLQKSVFSSKALDRVTANGTIEKVVHIGLKKHAKISYLNFETCHQRSE